jgi:high-affinity K+ transport system ATPase subunit B
MEEPDVFISVYAFLTQAFVCCGNVKVLFVKNAGTIPITQKIGDKFIKCGEGTEKTAFFSVSGTMSV